MEKENSKYILIFIGIIFLYSCQKTYTNYYEDAENRGLAIFSNTGNAIMTCKIAGRPWRTIDNRTFLLSGGRRYEVWVERLRSTGPSDSLIFNWTGYFIPESIPGSSLTLVMRIPKSFSYKDLSALQGQRLQIDTLSNGFFTTGIAGININNEKGNGSIYFHNSSFDSIAPNNYTGKMAGLFEADFPQVNITNGRFDHVFGADNFRF